MSWVAYASFWRNYIVRFSYDVRADQIKLANWEQMSSPEHEAVARSVAKEKQGPAGTPVAEGK